jgi:hypothetical protein
MQHEYRLRWRIGLPTVSVPEDPLQAARPFRIEDWIQRRVGLCPPPRFEVELEQQYDALPTTTVAAQCIEPIGVGQDGVPISHELPFLEHVHELDPTSVPWAAANDLKPSIGRVTRDTAR